MIPGWWAFVMLALAAYRTWRLVAEDTLLDPLRYRLVRSEKASEWLSCAWCSGFWVALGWWGAGWAWPHTALVAAVPFALSAALGLTAELLDRRSVP